MKEKEEDEENNQKICPEQSNTQTNKQTNRDFKYRGHSYPLWIVGGSGPIKEGQIEVQIESNKSRFRSIFLSVFLHIFRRFAQDNDNLNMTLIKDKGSRSLRFQFLFLKSEPVKICLSDQHFKVTLTKSVNTQHCQTQFVF